MHAVMINEQLKLISELYPLHHRTRIVDLFKNSSGLQNVLCCSSIIKCKCPEEKFLNEIYDLVESEL